MNKKRTLLIAEDEELLREVFCEICSSLTDNVLVAKNGEESLNILLSQHVDAVLSDINMPKMSGIEVLKKIRTAGLDTPYIILSGYGDIQNVKMSLQYGATDFLDKPCDETQLLSIIDRNLDLGVALKDSREAINLFFEGSNFPQEKLEKIKKAQQAINILRFENNYKKKAA